MSAASVRSTTLSVMANLVGAGLLSLPYTLKRAGLGAGIAGMFFMCAINAASMILIAHLCDLSKAYTYKDIGARALGSRMSYAITAVMALYTMGSCVSFVVLVGDFVTDLICTNGCAGGARGFFGSRIVVVAFVAVLLLYPLALQRNLNALRATSSLSTFCIIYSALMIAISAAVGPRAPADDLVTGGGVGIFVAFPILAVAFTLHYNVPKFYYELADRSLRKLGVVTTLSFVSVLALYLATAIGGYYLFGSATKSDVLLNFSTTNAAAIVARIALSAVVIACYPLAFNSLRISVCGLLPTSWQAVLSPLARPSRSPKRMLGKAASDEELASDHDDSSSHLLSENAELLPAAPAGGVAVATAPRQSFVQEIAEGLRNDWPHAVLTLCLLAVSAVIGVAVPNIGIVLTYKGALGGSLIVYIFPAWMYFALTQRALLAQRSGIHVEEGTQAPLEFTWRDVVFTRHGAVAMGSTLWGLTMMICGVLVAQGVIKTSADTSGGSAA